MCGGIILDAVTILSAAHCFYSQKDGTDWLENNNHKVIIRAGVTDSEDTKGQVSIVSCKIPMFA